MSAARRRFAERGLVTAGLLDAEQDERLERRRRHDRGFHRWGVVAGLAVEPADAGGIVVQPGMAVDGYGRTIVLADARTIPSERLRAQGGAAVDVWLVGCEVAAFAPGPRRGCGDGREDRRQPAPVVWLTAVDNPDRPPEKRAEAWPPEREDVAGDPWLVRLGRVNPSNGDVDDRWPVPYAGLVGEQVLAPSGDVRLGVGSLRAGDPVRFGVEIADAPGAPLTRRLTADDRGRVRVTGDAVSRGDVRVVGGVGWRPLAAPPDAATPWRVYRSEAAELRAEIEHPGQQGDPARSALTVATRESDRVQRCVAARADGALAVRPGSIRLAPAATVVQGPAQADADDPRFEAAVVARWLESVASTGLKLDSLYAGMLRVTLTTPGTVQAGTNLDYQATVRNAGPVRISDIIVTVTLRHGDQVLNTDTEHRASLDAGSSVAICKAIPIAGSLGGQTLDLDAAAVGVGPGGYPVAATAEQRTVDVESGGPA